jgi:type IV pilus assembly protein PilO
MLDRIFSLPKKQKIGILAGLIVAILAFYYTSFYSPQSYRVADLSEQIENSRSERDKKKKMAANRTQLREELRRLDGMLKEAIAQLPSLKEIPELLSSVSTKAREAGLDIILFRPRPENVQEFYAEVPVDVVVRGDFHDTVTFFDEVGRLSRMINMTNIELKTLKGKEEQGALEVITLATTFRFLDEKERAKIAAERAAKAAKK